MYNICTTTTFNIILVDEIEGTEYMPLAVEAWHKLLTYSHCGFTIQLNACSRAIVIIDTKRKIHAGIIVYEKIGEEYHIQLGYIRFLYRQQGLYDKLWEYLVQFSKSENIKRIYGDAFDTNEDIHKIMKKQGRKPFLTAYKYEVE